MAKTKPPVVIDAIKWIAANDNPGDNDSPDELAGYLTICMTADLFGGMPEQIAQLVYLVRNPGYKVPT